MRARFQGLFHSPSGVLFTFPSRYYALSVIDSYLALDGGPPGFGQDCTCPVLLGIPLGPVPARYGAITLFGRTFQSGSLAFAWSHGAVPQPRFRRTGLGSSPFARHYWGNHVCFLFLWVLRCFSSPGSPHHINMVIITLQVIGLSHSEIRGSRDICSYPRLIAACHVLHRLREPRHPPDALSSFRHNSSYFQL